MIIRSTKPFPTKIKLPEFVMPKASPVFVKEFEDESAEYVNNPVLFPKFDFIEYLRGTVKKFFADKIKKQDLIKTVENNGTASRKILINPNNHQSLEVITNNGVVVEKTLVDFKKGIKREKFYDQDGKKVQKTETYETPNGEEKVITVYSKNPTRTYTRTHFVNGEEKSIKTGRVRSLNE